MMMNTFQQSMYVRNTVTARHNAKTIIMGATLAAGLFIIQIPSASAHPAECTIGWDDRSALHKIFKQARNTFAIPTTVDQNGQYAVCQTNGNSALDNPGCWQYQQSC